jgi:hypothetical protein
VELVIKTDPLTYQVLISKWLNMSYRMTQKKESSFRVTPLGRRPQIDYGVALDVCIKTSNHEDKQGTYT